MEKGATAAQLAQIRDGLARYCGVYIDDARRRVIEQALARRLALLGESLESYMRRIAGLAGRAELQSLAELALNHETYFFRNAAQLEALRSTILPALHRRLPPGRPLRMWSAGCATGEEAYSLAICAYEALGTPLPRPVEIWATDLSLPALERASQGRYGSRAVAQLGPELIERYFSVEQGSYLVESALRQLVRFEQFNLLEAFPAQASGIELIFCQNVTIYFQLETCRDLIDRFYQLLPPEGMLFLGFSETLWQLYDRFQVRQLGAAFAYVKAPAVAPPPPRTASAGTAPLPRRPRQPRPAAPPAPPSVDLVVEAQRMLERSQRARALEHLRQVAPTSASYPAALALVARIHADGGDLDTAVAEARRAIAVDPLCEEAYLLLGCIHLRQGQATQAIAQLERARYLNARAPLVLFHLAEAYRQAGRQGDARREYTNALQALAAFGAEQLLEGVSVGWLRGTCQRYV